MCVPQVVAGRMKAKDLVGASYDIDCHITRDRVKTELKLEQHLYTRAITERFGIDNTALVPATAGVQPLSKEKVPKTPEEKEVITKIPSREAV